MADTSEDLLAGSKDTEEHIIMFSLTQYRAVQCSYLTVSPLHFVFLAVQQKGNVDSGRDLLGKLPETTQMLSDKSGSFVSLVQVLSKTRKP